MVVERSDGYEKRKKLSAVDDREKIKWFENLPPKSR